MATIYSPAVHIRIRLATVMRRSVVFQSNAPSMRAN